MVKPASIRLRPADAGRTCEHPAAADKTPNRLTKNDKKTNGRATSIKPRFPCPFYIYTLYRSKLNRHSYLRYVCVFVGSVCRRTFHVDIAEETLRRQAVAPGILRKLLMDFRKAFIRSAAINTNRRNRRKLTNIGTRACWSHGNNKGTAFFDRFSGAATLSIRCILIAVPG